MKKTNIEKNKKLMKRIEYITGIPVKKSKNKHFDQQGCRAYNISGVIQ